MEALSAEATKRGLEGWEMVSYTVQLASLESTDYYSNTISGLTSKTYTATAILKRPVAR